MEAAGLVQEFGTVSNLRALQVLRAEAALLREVEDTGAPTPEPSHPVRAAVREVFYPESERWRAAVLKRGLDLLATNLAWLAKNDA